ncbi:hypothetical protein PLESTF_001550200 [Pleodorina starrii]|nr:hypothetical protein PLESTF_001550200 [Pleodorina starrii]
MPLATCSISIIGDAALFEESSAAGGGPAATVPWAPELLHIVCTGPDGDPSTPVHIEVGGRLLPFLKAGGPHVTLSDNLVLLPSSTDVNGFSLTFVNYLRQLELIDSVLRRVPLSYNPLLSCLACDFVHLSNTRLEHLRGDPQPILTCDMFEPNVNALPNRTVGALYFYNVRGLSAEGLVCKDVRDANDFACLMVEMSSYDGQKLDPDAQLQLDYLRLTDSTFEGNSVKPGNCFVYREDNQGFGAVALHVDWLTHVTMGEVVLSNVIVVDNVGGTGAGLALNADSEPESEASLALSSLLIKDSVFAHNKARGNGGAVFIGSLVRNVQQVRLTSTILIANHAAGLDGGEAVGYGGALCSNTSVEALVVDGASVIIRNTANMHGGAFWLGRGVRSLSILDGSSVSENTAVGGHGGAVCILQRPNPVGGPLNPNVVGPSIEVTENITLSAGSHLDANGAGHFGGGLFVNAHVGQITVSGSSTISMNYAYYGGGMYVGKYSSQRGAADARFTVGTLLLSDGSSISANFAYSRGAGAYLGGSVNQSGIVIRDGSSIDDNFIISETAEAGGGVAVVGTLSGLIIRNGSSMSGNEVALLQSDERPPGQGGALWVLDSIRRIVVTDNSRISRNKAHRGGAAIAVSSPNSDNLMLAGVQYETELVLVSGNSCICDNQAGTDPAHPSLAGALYFELTRIVNFTVTNGSCLCRNAAVHGDGFGGAVQAQGGYGYFSVCNRSHMSNNEGGLGGALYVPRPYAMDAEGNGPIALEVFELCGDSRMDNNFGRTHGGALYVEGVMGSLSIVNSSVSNNKANIAGGAIYAVSMFQRFLIRDSQLTNNVAIVGQGGFCNLEVSSKNMRHVLPYNTADDAISSTPRRLPATGPYYMDVVRTTVSQNSAYKNGGAFAFQVYYYVPTVQNDSQRLQLQAERYLYMRVRESTFRQNWAHFGAGGAIAFLTLMPMDQEQQQPVSVSLGAFIDISNSSFIRNFAGEENVRLNFIHDVSSLQGNGGAVFLWASPYPIEPVPPTDYFTPPPLVESATCTRAEEDMPPGIRTFANASCWPTGSRTCALLLDGVNMTGNMATGGYGGGLNVAQCAVKIVRSRFSNNTSTIKGGGLAFMDYSAPWYITLANFSKAVRSATQPPSPPPVSLWSGLPYQAPDSSSLPPNLTALFQNINDGRPLQQPWLVMYNTTVERNTAVDAGGAFIEVNRTAAIVVNCVFSDNQAKGEGGGVVLISNSTLGKLTAMLRDTNFTGNVAGSFGGGLSVRATRNKAATVLMGGTIRENYAAHGGGIYSSGIRGTTLLLWDVSLLSNKASEAGGGISFEFSFFVPVVPTNNPLLNLPAYEAVVCLLACRLAENRGYISGGGAFLATTPSVRGMFRMTNITSNTAAYGAGIYLNASAGGQVQASGCTITGNVAQLQGGGAYAATNCGGKLVIDEASNLSSNSAVQNGGGVVVFRAVNGTTGGGQSSTGTTLTAAGQQAGAADVASVCSTASLVMSNATLAWNKALQGGGVYAASDTIAVVNDSLLANNTAWVSGGAIAAVNCSLLHMHRCMVVENLAALSGGGVFAGQCVAVIMENGSVILNTASTGAGVHVAGSQTADDGNIIATRRRRWLQQSSTSSGGAAAATEVSPTAVLSHVDVYGNTAVAGLYTSTPEESLLLSHVSSLLVQEYLPYQGHGGGMFFSGGVGVAVSGGRTRFGNIADVGTVLATTQACSESDLLLDEQQQQQSGDPVVQKLLNATAGSRRWSRAVSALSWAANLNCSMLVFWETRLPSSATVAATYSSRAASVSKAAAAARVQEVQSLPLLWLQDLSASSLQASCSSLSSIDSNSSSGGGDADSEALGIAQIIQQRIQARHSAAASTAAAAAAITATAASPPPPPPPPQQEPKGNVATYANSLPLLLKMLKACGEDPEAQQAAGVLPLAVPATHMRVMNISGALLLPHVGTAGAPPQYLHSTDGRAFSEADIRALVVAPNIAFDLQIQLFDSLGQPVVIDTPTFEVSITIRRPLEANSSSSKETTQAVLRSPDAATADILVTRYGVVSWQDLEFVGWPGSYIVDVKAKYTAAFAALPEIDDLSIHVELLPCEMGQELVKSKDKDHTSWTGCSNCRRDLVGLWTDKRTPLSRLLSNSTQQQQQQPGGTWLDSLIQEVKVLTASEGGQTCPSCCLSCPSHAACPGGPLLIPTAGYWHSHPSSPLFHRCPQPAACGAAAGSDDIDPIWNQTLKANFNISDSYVVINTTAGGSAASIVNSTSMGSGVISLSSDDFILVSLRDDIRGLLLGACQQWWYSTFPPNQEGVLVSQYDIALQVNMSAAPCFLHQPAAMAMIMRSGQSDASAGRWYNQLQCATGYTGHLCATCMPGYSLTVDFGCMECPALARTISVGLLAFWGTVFLLLFTTFSNLSKNRAEAMQMEELSALDLLKTLITHIQYFIIITKLGINYPAIITKFQSVLSALTGTENYIAYSPSCLFPGLDSGGQAAHQIAFGLSAPCMATLVTLILWIIRYLIANQSLFGRRNAKRWDPDGFLKELPPVPSEDLGDNPQAAAGAGGPSDINKCASLGAPPASSFIPDTASAGLISNISAACPPQASKIDAIASIQYTPPLVSMDSAATGLTATTSRQNNACTPDTAASNKAPQQAQQATLAPSPSLLPIWGRLPSTPGSKLPSCMAAGGSQLPQVCIELDGSDSTPAASWNTHRGADRGPPLQTPVSSSVAVAAGGTTATPGTETPGSATAAADTAAAAGTPAPAKPPAATPPRTTTPMPADVTPSTGSPAEHALPQGAPNPFATATPTFGSTMCGRRGMTPSVRSLAGSGHFNIDSDLPRPFSSMRSQQSVDEEDDGSGGDWKQALANMFANPGQWLMFADQAVPLLQQLEVVVIAASFILYPSLCQISLSIFACYKLDSGQGAFAENQQAAWHRGYWVRNMQQECYTGLHERVYVPIGIGSVILFCLCPPVVYFLLTFKSRHQFNDPRIRIQYGFLYQQYKPKYFWWASMRQLQVLALVAVEVFGRALPVLQQALLLLAVLILIAAVNTANSPERFQELLILEFLSMCVLSMTLTLGLYFVGDDLDSQLDNTSENVVGSIILVINAVFILAVLFFMAKRSAEAARKVKRVLYRSWHSMVIRVSRAISKIEARYSGENAAGGAHGGGSRRPPSRVSLKLST